MVDIPNKVPNISIKDCSSQTDQELVQLLGTAGHHYGAFQLAYDQYRTLIGDAEPMVRARLFGQFSEHIPPTIEAYQKALCRLEVMITQKGEDYVLYMNGPTIGELHKTITTHLRLVTKFCKEGEIQSLCKNLSTHVPS